MAGERIVVAYQQVFDLPFTIIRPSALYGPGCVSRRVAQIFIENAISGSNLRIDGDGSERLDFTFVEDLVEGVRLVIENPASINQTFNLTYGSSRSVQELAEIIRDHFELTEIEYGDRDSLMPVRGTLSIDKARSLIGYSPENSIDRGIPKYIKWYKGLTGSG